MNLHGVVVKHIAAINPQTIVTVQKSNGYTTNADGTQVPSYTPIVASVQVSALSVRESKHLDSSNIQGVIRKLYAYGELNSAIRAAMEGGDLIELDSHLWKVVHVFETWPGWSASAIKMQVDL